VASSAPLPTGLPLDAAEWEPTPPVVRQLVLQWLEVIQQLEARGKTLEARIAELEARLPQRSSHADRPPSSDPPYEQRAAHAGTQGSPGAKPGHRGHRRVLLEPTQVIEVTPEACPCGQREFPETTPYHTHQVLELPPIQMQVIHVILHATCGPQCGRRLKAPLPAEHRDGCGPRVTALLGALSGSPRSRRSAGQACCNAVLGRPMSQGAIQHAVDRVSQAIKPHDAAIAAKAREAKVNSMDETTWSQHGVLAWLWVMVNTTVALFKVQASRHKATFEALIERWAGILVRDGDGGYCQWVHARQTGLAHVLRRARGLAERPQPELAWFGHRVLAEWQRLVHWATAPPTAGEVQTWYARMVHLRPQHGARQDEAGTFARTLERELGALWTCVVEHGVEPTNTRAARALRFAVLWRKSMQGRDNEKGDRWVERRLSLRETCRVRGTPTFPILVDAVTCYFKGQQPDVSWIE
jgi:transposase